MKWRFLKYLYYKFYWMGSSSGNSNVGFIFSMGLMFLFYGIVLLLDILLCPKTIRLPNPFWIIGVFMILSIVLTIAFYYMDKKTFKDEDEKMEYYKEEFKDDSCWPAIIVGVAPFVFMIAMCFLKMFQNRGAF